MAEENVAHRWIVQGRVQGVSYRWFTREEAHRLGVAGTVRNRADGTVEVKVLGLRPAVERLRDRLWQGPPMSRVDALDAHPLDPAEAERIRRSATFEIVF